ncbi:MAG: diphthine synthase [Candidatus Atabeyarchaeum deiterrae]
MNGQSPSASGPKKERNGELILVGMGLWDHNGVSLSGLEVAKTADAVYAELYTSIMPALDLNQMERIIGKSITVLKRKDLEEDVDNKLLKSAQEKRVVLFVPGDPLAATTHVSLRLRAYELGVKTHVVHAASIFSVAASITGLQHYKFGKAVTISIPREGYFPMSPYGVVSDNLSRGLHTLLLLDLDVERLKYLSISEALKLLVKMEKAKGMKVFTDDRLMVGLARIGSPEPIIRCDSIKRLGELNFGSPPHTLIVPGTLHFMEAESLVKLFGAPPSISSRKSIVD